MNDLVDNINLREGTLASEPKVPMRPLQSELNEQGEQIEKLAGLLDNLVGRLHPVRNSMPRDDGSTTQQSSPSYSQITDQIVVQTSRIKSLQVTVSTLLEELEI